MAVTLTQLRAFVAVARDGSVQGAATHLFVSQPSVSAALASLERQVGLDLLERHGRGIRLTAAGRAYLPYAAEVLGLLEQAGFGGLRYRALCRLASKVCAEPRAASLEREMVA